MRFSSVEDFLRIFQHYGIDPRIGKAIDVGGTQLVSLKRKCSHKVERNPLLDINNNLIFLDAGFNVSTFDTKTDMMLDFLDEGAIKSLKDSYDMVFCFDTLEHVADPFRFCNHLVHITKPGGYIYVSTAFKFVYHPSPEDYYRFSPSGLNQCFVNGLKDHDMQYSVLWYGWESDEFGVALLAQKEIVAPKQIDQELLVTKQVRNKFLNRVVSRLVFMGQRYLERQHT